MYVLLALCSQSNLLLFSLPVAVMWFVVYFKPLKYTSWYILVFLLFLPIGGMGVPISVLPLQTEGLLLGLAGSPLGSPRVRAAFSAQSCSARAAL